MQYTEFNKELVLLVETSDDIINSLDFRRKPGGEHIHHVLVWQARESIDEMHSSPSTGKVYMLFWNVQAIFEYTSTDYAFLRYVFISNLYLRLLGCHSYKFVDLNDQVSIVIHSNTHQGGVVTVPINNLDERHVISSRALPDISACLDSVTDKHGNLFILTDEGDFYGIALAPVSQEEQVRFLINIPKSDIDINSGRVNQLIFDENRGLIFLSLQTSKRILWYRVARMYNELNVWDQSSSVLPSCWLCLCSRLLHHYFLFVYNFSIFTAKNHTILFIENLNNIEIQVNKLQIYSFPEQLTPSPKSTTLLEYYINSILLILFTLNSLTSKTQ